MHAESLIAGTKSFGSLPTCALMCTGIVIIEFILLNVFNFPIRHYFLTGGPQTSNMESFDKVFLKFVGGTAEEPGSMALLLNIICPIGIMYFHITKAVFKKYVLIVAYFLSLCFLLSTAAFIALLIGLGLISLAKAFNCLTKAKIRPVVSRNRLAMFAGGSILTLSLIAGTYDYLWKPLSMIAQESMLLKVSLSEESVSASQRVYMWNKAIEHFQSSKAFGKGPGFGVEFQTQGYHSVFLTLLADTGIFSFLCFCVFLAAIFRKMLNLPSSLKYFFFIPFFGSIFHFCVISDYYHPPFWIMIILIQIIYEQSKTTPVMKYKAGELT